MVVQLASASLSVEELFSPPFQFVSPNFQRPFSWQVETAERLLGDIQASSANAPNDIYFLGAVLLVGIPLPTDPAGGTPPAEMFKGRERVFEIVDGQQRMVTLAILAAVLRDLTGQGKTPFSRRLAAALSAVQADNPRVQLRGPDNIFLQQCIGAAGRCLQPPPVEPATEPQRRMVEIRDFFVHQLTQLNPVELQQLATFVMQNCALVAIVTNTVDRAFQMFTVLNDSGEPLTRNDILKAELIGQIAAGERGRATEVWDELEQKLGENFEQLFSFVRAHSGRGSIPIVEAIRAQVASVPGGAAAFIFNTLAPAGRVVDVILRAAHQGAPESGQINKMLRYLGWLPGKEWVPPLLAYWLRHGNNPTALLTFLTTLDRFAYGVRLHGLGADKRGQRMAAATELIDSAIGADGPWPPLQFSRDELRTIQNSLRDLYKRSPQTCRLVLLRLDELFGGGPMTGTDRLTIEHVLPLKVAPNSQWRKDFPDADVRQRLAACLGNLVLVTGPVNERAANHDFEKKVAIYFADPKHVVTKLTDELRGVSTWTQPQIEARLIRLTGGLNELWNLEPASAR